MNLTHCWTLKNSIQDHLSYVIHLKLIHERYIIFKNGYKNRKRKDNLGDELNIVLQKEIINIYARYIHGISCKYEQTVILLCRYSS